VLSVRNPFRMARDIARDEDGIAAVEFAMVAPVLILLLMGTVEFPRAYGTSQGLEKAARTMADLISRGSLNSVDDVFAAGSAVAFPYDTASAKVVLTAVGVYQKGTALVARVCSAAVRNDTAPAVDSEIGEPIPAEAKPGARYVTAKVSMRYAPVFGIFPGLDSLTFEKSVSWPVRGTGANSLAETVLPGGKACK
jgi:Flp pilus assembly protein TadG